MITEAGFIVNRRAVVWAADDTLYFCLALRAA